MALHGDMLAKDCNISILFAKVRIDLSTSPACSDPDPDGVATQLTRVCGQVLQSHLSVKSLFLLVLRPASLPPGSGSPEAGNPGRQACSSGRSKLPQDQDPRAGTGPTLLQQMP